MWDLFRFPIPLWSNQQMMWTKHFHLRQHLDSTACAQSSFLRQTRKNKEQLTQSFQQHNPWWAVSSDAWNSSHDVLYPDKYPNKAKDPQRNNCNVAWQSMKNKSSWLEHARKSSELTRWYGGRVWNRYKKINVLSSATSKIKSRQKQKLSARDNVFEAWETLQHYPVKIEEPFNTIRINVSQPNHLTSGIICWKPSAQISPGWIEFLMVDAYKGYVNKPKTNLQNEMGRTHHTVWPYVFQASFHNNPHDHVTGNVCKRRESSLQTFLNTYVNSATWTPLKHHVKQSHIYLYSDNIKGGTFFRIPTNPKMRKHYFNMDELTKKVDHETCRERIPWNYFRDLK